MSMTSGVCGGGGRHLPVQQGRQTYYQTGPFSARLAPSLTQKMLEDTPDELWLGLFVKPPNADGDGYEELACENYARAPVVLTSFSSQFYANVEQVAFSFEQGVDVTHVGLFDADGRLRFYGFLSGYQQSTEAPREICLRACEMKVRKPPIFSGSGRSHIGGRPAT